RNEQRNSQGAGTAQLPHRARRQRDAPGASLPDTLGPGSLKTWTRNEPGGQGRRLGREAPPAPRAPDGAARGARVDRADRGCHDTAAGRQSSRIRGAGAAHGLDEQRARHHARRAGGAAPPGSRGHRGGRVKRKPRRKARPKTASKLSARRLPVNGPAVGDTDPLADARIRPLLERYCRLAGVKQAALGPDHAELSLPKSERSFFRDRASLRLAFSLDALERDPDAEIAVLGSPFLSQLIEAIRARAARLSLGLIAPPATAASDPGGVEPTIPARDGTVTRGP